MPVPDLVPPAPPQPLFGIEKRLEMYQQMLGDLKEQSVYQQKAIAFYTQSLESLQAEAENTQNELQACQNIIQSLTNTSQLTQTVTQTDKASSNGHLPQAVEPEPTEKGKTKTKTAKAPAKAKTKTKTKAKTPVKASLASSTKTAPAKSKSIAKSSSTLPSSEIVGKFETITAMILDFVKSRDGVIEVSDIMKYAYPNQDLDQAQYKKASRSFSTVLSEQSKKGVLERTVPGKYMWRGKR